MGNAKQPTTVVPSPPAATAPTVTQPATNQNTAPVTNAKPAPSLPPLPTSPSKPLQDFLASLLHENQLKLKKDDAEKYIEEIFDSYGINNITDFQDTSPKLYPTKPAAFQNRLLRIYQFLYYGYQLDSNVTFSKVKQCLREHFPTSLLQTVDMFIESIVPQQTPTVQDIIPRDITLKKLQKG